MNPLVASVIRTLVPVAVGQVASWLLLLNVTLPLSAQEGLGAFLGGLLTAIYYVGVRIIEQQWPAFGVLLGLPKSPDTYSKDVPLVPAVPESPALTALALGSWEGDGHGVNHDNPSLGTAPPTVFPAAKVEAALAAPIEVTPPATFIP